MKNIIERSLIKILKLLKSDLLTHAHIQIGAGHNTYSSGEEFVVKTILQKIIKRPLSVVFDIGANTGEYAKMVHTNFPAADIYCFEPGPETFKKLLENTNSPKIHCRNIAVGSKNGTINLFRGSKDEDGTMVTAYKDTITDIFTFAGEVSEYLVSGMITVDDFCSSNNISSIDFLKIDVEGHELEVLKGALKMINENRISVIQFEFNEFNIVSRAFMRDYYNILHQYHFYRIMPQNKLYAMGNYTPSHEIFRYQNILAINNALEYNYAN